MSPTRLAPVLSTLVLALAVSARASDFNGDGYDDLAIASRGIAGMTAPGRVHVLFGGAGGIDTTDTVKLSPSQFGIADNFADFGVGLAGGDFDGDGFDDLAVGAPNTSVSGHAGAGVVVVVRGGPFGFDIANAKTFSQDTPGIDEAAEDPVVALSGPIDYPEWFGSTLAAGDLNGDGRDDLAIGVSENLPGSIAAGGFHVLMGSKKGLTAKKSRFFTQDSKNVPGDAEPFDRFASTIVAGDVNGDGRDDLCIGAFGEANEASEPFGRAWIFFGASSGIDAKRCREFGPADLGEDGDLASTNTGVGRSFAVGNCDGAGRPELVVGLSGHAMGAGAISSITARKKTLDLATTRARTQNNLGFESSEEGDYFGWALACADFDGDGYDDVAASALGEDLSGLFDTGITMVVSGGPEGLHEYAAPIIPGTNGIPGSIQQSAQAGQLLATGDFDADGFADLVIAAPPYLVNQLAFGGTDYPGAGVVLVLRGSPIGLIGAGARFFSEPGGATQYNLFGLAISN